MELSDPHVVRALAESDRLMGVGASATQFRFPAWHAVFVGLLSIVFGAVWDVPRHAANGWAGAIRLPLVFMLAASGVVATRFAWRRARPLSSGFGWMRPAAFAAVLLLYGVVTGLGFGLRAVGVPLPFTCAGLGYGVVLAGGLRLGAPWINVKYRKNIERGRW